MDKGNTTSLKVVEWTENALNYAIKVFCFAGTYRLYFVFKQTIDHNN